MKHLGLEETRTLLVQSLNMGLDIRGETTFTNSFDVIVSEDGFQFVPRIPAGYVLDDALYQRIFGIASGALYPYYTMLKQNGAYFVPLPENSVHTARAFFFPWLEGIPTRLDITDMEKFKSGIAEGVLPVMANLAISIGDIAHLVIAGNSGAGKSYALTYLLEMMKEQTTLKIVDPKMDAPTRWAEKNDVDVLIPDGDRSQNDFVNLVCDLLSEALQVVRTRQLALKDNARSQFTPYILVIDELLALTSSVSKSMKDTFFGLLSQVALLGRATGVKLILLSQRFDANALPVVVREQANVMIQLGNVNRKTTQFLLPDLSNLDGIVIPPGKGTGLIQIIDGKHPANVMPLLMPTYGEV
ncbi:MULTISPECIES: cell division protein FtsK [Levilactobacillus]|uniref:Cell division protein FtsK n=1 Tax=Levilactobacillus suantsaiihabitans TaxID=2487722 RepID=A0A4Z0J9Q7_9LACO|nr:cell division protein FtsK [Levilactobacillus suantsaiihabitans]TGD19473.1 cell division protein FtsK [Levilactobacillus suantsaiihabitans]